MLTLNNISSLTIIAITCISPIFTGYASSLGDGGNSGWKPLSSPHGGGSEGIGSFGGGHSLGLSYGGSLGGDHGALQGHAISYGGSLGGGSLGGDHGALQGHNFDQLLSIGHGQSGGGEGDFHHGISIVGGGGEQHGPSFDLTKHAAISEHSGLYGGSFISTGKYGSGEHQQDSGHGWQAALLAASSGGYGAAAGPGLGSYSVNEEESHGDISGYEHLQNLHGAAAAGGHEYGGGHY